MLVEREGEAMVFSADLELFDTDGNGFISMSEFFIYALEEALSHSRGAVGEVLRTSSKILGLFLPLFRCPSWR